MIPISEIVDRWKSVSNVPIYVGSVPEGTRTPYVNLNVIQSNPIRTTGDQIAFTESLLSFKAVADKLVDAEQIGAVALEAFDKGPTGWPISHTILDMVLMNTAFDYSPQPNLSGNRPWMAMQEFRLRS